MADAKQLSPGGPFPELRAPVATGGDIVLPGDAEGRWAAVIFYRGRF